MLRLVASQKQVKTSRALLRQHFAQMFEQAKREWDRTHTHRPAVIVAGGAVEPKVAANV